MGSDYGCLIRKIKININGPETTNGGQMPDKKMPSVQGSLEHFSIYVYKYDVE